MYFIRRAKLDDQSALFKLSKTVHFINLPADRDIIAEKISTSRKAFVRAARGETPHIGAAAGENPGGLSESVRETDLYMYVLDDTDNPGCLGSSQLIAQMGGPHNPNLCFKLERREKYSESLKVGTSNVVATLHEDPSGPTEIGGLIIQPSLRGHPARLGLFLALVRFHFIGRYRNRFRDEILSEMMAPITADGHNLLWDHLGRRFIPLSYTEADRFCQYSREFIKSLLPTGDIHLSLLPPEAREVVGRVGPETAPARRMLERLGFVYNNLVDPFDGGPFLRAKTDAIWLVKETKEAEVGQVVPKTKTTERAIVSVLKDDGEFLAIQDSIALSRGKLSLTKDAMKALAIGPGDTVGYTIMPDRSKPAASRNGSTTRSANRSKPTTKPVTKPKKKAATKSPSAKKTTKRTTRKTRS